MEKNHQPARSGFRRGERRRMLVIYRLVKIIPLRVFFLDQLQLPRTLSFLDLSFARKGVLARNMRLEPDQPVHAVF